MNVDDAIRDFRTSVRGPAERLVDEIVAAAPSTRRVRSRPRVTGRTVVVATSVSMAFLVVVTLAIVLRGGNRPDPAPATPVVPPARVAWGMVATVKLTPDPGVSIEEMRERFARALAFRVHDDDGAGVEIIDQRDDTVRVRLPGAELEAQAKGYLRFSRLVLVDEATDVLASGPRLRSLKAAAQKLIGPSTPTAYYVQMVEGGGKAVSQPTRFDSRSKASAVARRIGAGKVDLIAIPRSMAIVTSPASSSGVPVYLVRPTTTLPSSAIRNVDAGDREVTIALDPSMTPAHDVRLRVFRDDSGVGRLGGLATDVGVGVLGVDGRLTLPTEFSWTGLVPRLDIGGRVVVERAGRYGSRPAIPGRVFTPPTGAYQYKPTRGRPTARWIRVAEGPMNGRRAVLEVAETDGVVSAVGLRDPRDPRWSYGGFSLVTFRDTRTNARHDSGCPYNVGTPRVAVCNGGAGTSTVSQPGRHVATTVAYGPVQPEVARIAVEWGGIRRNAVVTNGWWFVRMSIDLAKWGRPRAGHPLGNVGLPEILAWDADGNPIPVPSQARL